MEWWTWPLALFAVTFAIAVVAVLGGVGGGVLFVPIVGAVFPFHLDFVRAAGLLVALTTSLSAAPSLLANGLASLRLAMPLALIGSVTSIVGAIVGLALPTRAVQISLGVAILAIAAFMWGVGRSPRERVMQSDPLAVALSMHGVYQDGAISRRVEWKVHRTPTALVVFAGIGMLAGMFGLGAGWANVPALHVLMGAPLKLSVGTSGLLLSVVDTSAAWVYLNRGAVLPLVVVPSILGAILGAKIGARLLGLAPALLVRRIVLALLVVAGGRALLRGLGI
ncbi:MAG TPA: sulfite exporter TauE/SafE family protein [Burkholderiales bacterium]|nr:sulfite exporter TauE/SafE family protein [Burkholderiales bacterium]